MAEAKVAPDSAAALSPEAAVEALLRTAGPGAGSPPPEVVGAALKAMGVAATAENVERALRAALGGATPTSEQVAAAQQTASAGLPPDFFDSPLPGAEPSAAAAPPLTSQSPEAVIQMLIQAAGPGAGHPPADVVGTALRQAGVEITTDNVIRALKEAAGPGAGEPSSKVLGEALKAAMAAPGPNGFGVGPTSDALKTPGASAAPGASPGAMPGAAPQTPEEVVETLLALVGKEAGEAPAEVLGAALVASGLPASRENVLRALKAAGRATTAEEDIQKAMAAAAAGAAGAGAVPPGAGGMSTPEEVVFALRTAAGPGAGRPPAQVVGVALKQAQVTPLSAEVVIRALKEAGYNEPSAQEVQAALKGAATGEFPEEA